MIRAMAVEEKDDTQVSERYALTDAMMRLATTDRPMSLEVASMLALELCERFLEGANLDPAAVYIDQFGLLHVSRGRTRGFTLRATLEHLTHAVHSSARGTYESIRNTPLEGTQEDQAEELRARFADALFPVDRAAARRSLASALEKSGSKSPESKSVATSKGRAVQYVLSGLDDTVLRRRPGATGFSRIDWHGPSPTDKASAYFGPYEVFGEIACGGMAQVLLGRDPEDRERVFVIKRMLGTIAEQQNFQQMFRDEARLGLYLQHPNICQTLAFEQVGNAPCIRMEWAAGLTLNEILVRSIRQKKPLPMEGAMRIARALASALHHAHSATDPTSGRKLRVVHRDVSPQNVVVQFDGVVKLLDFGVARSAIREEGTSAGQIKGKFAYMSPEQALGLPLDDRSDVFCLGICLHEALTARPLFARDTRFAVVRALAKEGAPKVSATRPEIPKAVDSLVARCLSSQPKNRPRMGELVGELEEIIKTFEDAPELKAYVRSLAPDWKDWRKGLSPFESEYIGEEARSGIDGAEITREEAEPATSAERITDPIGQVSISSSASFPMGIIDGPTSLEIDLSEIDRALPSQETDPDLIRSEEIEDVGDDPFEASENELPIVGEEDDEPATLVHAPDQDSEQAAQSSVAEPTPPEEKRGGLARALPWLTGIAVLLATAAVTWRVLNLRAAHREELDRPREESPRDEPRSEEAESAASEESTEEDTADQEQTIPVEPSGDTEASSGEVEAIAGDEEDTTDDEARQEAETDASEEAAVEESAEDQAAVDQAAEDQAAVEESATDQAAEESTADETDAATLAAEAEETAEDSAERGALLVQSEPSGASIRIDGRPAVFETPHRFTSLSAGTHQVTVEKDGHPSVTRSVRIRSGQSGLLRVRLGPPILN